MRWVRPLPILLALAGCVTTPRLAQAPTQAGPAPRFDALAFFDGRLEGAGRLRKLFSAAEPMRVESRGTIERGALRLDQTVYEAARLPRHRVWLIRETAPGRYAGTLSDAAGPIAGEAIGNRLHLAFTMKGGLRADQWLTLSPDGRRAYNVLEVRKLGVTVAMLAEDIRRLD